MTPPEIFENPSEAALKHLHVMFTATLHIKLAKNIFGHWSHVVNVIALDNMLKPVAFILKIEWKHVKISFRGPLRVKIHISVLVCEWSSRKCHDTSALKIKRWLMWSVSRSEKFSPQLWLFRSNRMWSAPPSWPTCASGFLSRQSWGEFLRFHPFSHPCRWFCSVASRFPSESHS